MSKDEDLINDGIRPQGTSSAGFPGLPFAEGGLTGPEASGGMRREEPADALAALLSSGKP